MVQVLETRTRRRVSIVGGEIALKMAMINGGTRKCATGTVL